MYCINHEHSLKNKIVGLNGWREPKCHRRGIPKVLLYCISIGELDVERNFSQIDLWDYVVRRTISFCNKNYKFSVGESLVEIFKCCAMDVLNVNYFIFSFVSMYYEIILTLWTYVLVWMLSSLFSEISTMSNDGFHK